jgi:glycerol-3-phosphate O-acyltransferase/dihydroxyacetone phosphate acyltransferase
MLVDPAIVCQAFSKEHLHYWAKNTVFINNYATRLLDSVGCVPVDRNSKDHSTLYKATFDVFDEKESIVVFPEGTSHTLPHLGKLRDGASFVRFYFYQI